ncbi:MAG: cache domain-containing protein [Desulfobaccales bacterium]
MMKLRYLWAAVIAAMTLAALMALGRMEANQAPLPYIYEDTKQLVLFVEDAAQLVETRGTEAFREFAVKGSRWFNDNYYLFIYNLDGVCLFHPVAPELVGRNLLGLKDMNGKPMVRNITDIGRGPDPKAAGWVFYLWEPRTDLTPYWKVSYIRKAVGPDGKVYMLGCGVHNFKIENLFVKDCVDKAVELLKSQGKEAAFAQFRDRASPFFFCDTYIHVFDDKGWCLVDPAFPNMEKRDLTSFQDALGHYVVKEMLKRLSKSETAWLQYMLPQPGSALPSRKLAYLRKVSINGEVLIVWAEFFQATPIWMKI